MKMKHKHNVSRLLSLLLVVAALAGLLSVGALAADGLSISIENVTKSDDGSTVTADVVVNGSASIAAGEFTVVVPEGLTLTNIKGNAFSSKNLDGIDGLNVVVNVDRNYMGFFVNIADEDIDAWNPSDGKTKIASLTFTVNEGAYGSQTIGLSGVTLGSDGSGEAGGSVSISGAYTVDMSSASATLKLPGATLTFDANGHGTAPAAQSVAVGGTVTAPEAPTATGYTFGGWYTEAACNTEFTFGTLSADTTVYAKWTANTYTVTLNADGGTCDKETVQVTYDSTYGTLPTPVKTGHTFKGWFDGETKVESTTAVTKADDHILTAKWDINQYTVTFDAQGGECSVTSRTVNYNEAYGTLPAPTKDGYNFVGWFTAADGGTQVSADGKVTDNVTLYARWDEQGVLPVDTAVQTATYDGSDKSFTVKATTEVENFPSDFTVTYLQNGTEVTPVNAGSYDVKITHAEVKNGDDVVWTAYEKTITGGLVIEKATVAEPAKDNTAFTYTGSEQTYTVAENALYTVSGNKQTNAGTHAVTITLEDADNYKWETADSSEPLTYDFVIAKAKVNKPTADTTEFTYDGSSKTYTLATSDEYTVSENTTQKDAGTYEITVTLNDSNHQWADGTTGALTYTFTINPKSITAPAADTTDFTYDGGKKTYGIHSTDDYTVEGNEKTDAGEYTVTVSLKDPKNTSWADGTTAAKEYTFTIAKAEQEAPTGLTAEAESINGKADGKIDGVDKTMEYSTDGESWTAIGGKKLENLAAGTYYVRYAEKDNYKASAPVAVTVDEGDPIVVSFVTGCEVEVEDQELAYDDTVAEPTTTRGGYELLGWYKDPDLKKAWNFAEDTVTEDTILYAAWGYYVSGTTGSFTVEEAPEAGIEITIGGGLDLEDAGVEVEAVKVNGKNLDAEDYTVAYNENGSLVVTLTQDYLNALKVGEYALTVELANVDGVADTVQFAFKVAAKAAAEGGSTGTDKNAPHTGDESDLLLWSVITLGAGAGLVCIGKKRREN